MCYRFNIWSESIHHLGKEQSIKTNLQFDVNLLFFKSDLIFFIKLFIISTYIRLKVLRYLCSIEVTCLPLEHSIDIL